MSAIDESAGSGGAALPTWSLLDWVTTTDHKKIGLMYLVTSFAFFAIGGLLAVTMRTQLADAGQTILGRDTYNEFFTMHGTVMMFLFAVPAASALANYFIPLHVGAPDMAFPRLNALSYWLFLGGGIVMLSGFATARGAADFGWTGYPPLSTSTYSPGAGADLWIAGLVLTGVASVLTAVNVITTVITLRAPGMTMFRIPIFAWNMLVTSFLMLLAFPVLTAAGAMLWADRRLGAEFFSENGEPILWQHLFWFFGHPEVYIIALPFFGVVTEIIPVFSRKPVFGYKAIVFSSLLIAAYSVTVWAHHMFTTGAVLIPFFSGMTLLIAVPTGIKYFSWVATMWRGKLSFETPMLFALGMLAVFLIGGLTGPMLAIAALDVHLHDTYFVVAHMHYVLVGAAVFGIFAAIYFWFPKWTGRLMSERLGKLHALLLFAGVNLTFFPQHMLGLEGMPRRFFDYPEDLGYDGYHLLSTIGSYVTALAVVVFVVNVVQSWRSGPGSGDDPWGGYTLEWVTTSPPPTHNFHALPVIRSERPAFDQRHPELVGESKG